MVSTTIAHMKEGVIPPSSSLLSPANTAGNEILKEIATELGRHHLPVIDSWLESIYAHVTSSSSSTRPIVSLSREIYTYILFTPLQLATKPTLPSDIHSYDRQILTGTYVLQCHSVTVVSHPNRSDSDSDSRMLKLVLSDGYQFVTAIELIKCPSIPSASERAPCTITTDSILALPPKDRVDTLWIGYKIAIRDAPMRRGTLLLTPGLVLMLGGQCNFDELQYKLENAHDKCLLQSQQVNSKIITQTAPIPSHRDAKNSNSIVQPPNTLQSFSSPTKSIASLRDNNSYVPTLISDEKVAQLQPILLQIPTNVSQTSDTTTKTKQHKNESIYQREDSPFRLTPELPDEENSLPALELDDSKDDSKELIQSNIIKFTTHDTDFAPVLTTSLRKSISNSDGANNFYESNDVHVVGNIQPTAIPILDSVEQEIVDILSNEHIAPIQSSSFIRSSEMLKEMELIPQHNASSKPASTGTKTEISDAELEEFLRCVDEEQKSQSTIRDDDIEMAQVASREINDDDVIVIDSDDDEATTDDENSTEITQNFEQEIPIIPNLTPFLLRLLELSSERNKRTTPFQFVTYATTVALGSFQSSPYYRLLLWIDDGTDKTAVAVSHQMTTAMFGCTESQLNQNSEEYNSRRAQVENLLPTLSGVMTIHVASNSVNSSCIYKHLYGDYPILVGVDSCHELYLNLLKQHSSSAPKNP